MGNTTSSTLSADLQTYFSKKLQIQAKYKNVLDQFGWTENIPANSSKTISFTQYSDLAPTTSSLTEGTPPTNEALSSTATTATINQIGAYVTLTDLATLTVKHPVTQKCTELLGVQGARSYDRLINSTVVAGTNVVYAGGAASRTALASNNVLTTTEIRKAVTQLRNNGATEFDDGNFVLVIDPSVEGDLLGDTTFANTVYRQSVPAKQNELYKGIVTVWGGVTVVRSNNIPTISSTVTVHTSYVFGQNSYAVTDLQSMQMYTEGPGTVSDPLHQIMTMGWKCGFACVILNNNFMVRIESASAY
jgi:N4-gp56 family major capsid protein